MNHSLTHTRLSPCLANPSIKTEPEVSSPEVRQEAANKLANALRTPHNMPASDSLAASLTAPEAASMDDTAHRSLRASPVDTSVAAAASAELAPGNVDQRSSDARTPPAAAAKEEQMLEEAAAEEVQPAPPVTSSGGGGAEEDDGTATPPSYAAAAAASPVTTALQVNTSTAMLDGPASTPSPGQHSAGSRSSASAGPLAFLSPVTGMWSDFLNDDTVAHSPPRVSPTSGRTLHEVSYRGCCMLAVH